MAYIYNPYQNQYYTQMQMPQAVNPPMQIQQQQQQQPNQNGLIWVQGETGAKSHLVAPNTTVMLMDSETQRFFLKSSDASGMPLPLRIFEYTETTKTGAEPMQQTVDLTPYATKAEFDAFREEINGILKNVPKKTADTKGAENE